MSGSDGMGSNLRAENAELRERCEALEKRCASVADELAVVLEVREPGGCQCDDDEACRFVRERDEARARCAKLADAYTTVDAENAGLSQGLDDARGLLEECLPWLPRSPSAQRLARRVRAVLKTDSGEPAPREP